MLGDGTATLGSEVSAVPVIIEGNRSTLTPSIPRGSVSGLAAVVGYRRETRNEEVVMAVEIRAEMVANVWKVVAAPGNSVDDGDTLVILESMKMEIPVLADAAGVLKELAVNEGDVVQEGDLIAVIE